MPREAKAKTITAKHKIDPLQGKHLGVDGTVQTPFVSLYFTLLNFIDVEFFFSGTIFPTTFADFTSLYHILVILTIFQTFSWLSCLLWWSVWSVIMIPWKLRWWLAFFNNKVFFFYLKCAHCVFILFLFFKVYLFILREKVSRGGAERERERERERENSRQAARCRGAQ